MPVDPELLRQARESIEKQAVLVPALVGAGLGLGLAPKNNKLRGTLRGAGVGLTTGVAAPLGGVVGALGGGLSGAALGGLAGAGAGLLGAGGGDIANTAAAGATLGAGFGGIGGAIGGGVLGGVKGFEFGKRHIWDQPWPGDREMPHGISGADHGDEDESEQKKVASFAQQIGELAANRTRK